MSDPMPMKKRRRYANSCDICKKKRIRCDSSTMPNNICSNCIAFGEPCTHVAASLTKAKKTDPLSRMQRVSPDLDRSAPYFFESNAPIRSLVSTILSPAPPYDPPTDKASVRRTIFELAQYISILEKELATRTDSNEPTSSNSVRQPSVPKSAGSGSNPGPSHGSPSNEELELSETFSSVAVTNDARFFGTSSTAVLVEIAKEVKQGFPENLQPPVPQYISKRPEFWTEQPWDCPPEDYPQPLAFPTMDVMAHLVDLYFDRVNDTIPILHRPTFERLIGEGYHLQDHQFGSTVLAVLALGSRFSSHPEVYIQGFESEEHSRGWQWFSQINLIRRHFRNPTTLYELQLYPICVLYLYGSSTGDGVRILSCLSIHLAQDIGVHKKRPPGSPATVEHELWKRAWWACLAIDIFTSAFTGRPRATTKQDHDQEYPVDCDDEFWENPDPSQAFQQPAGKPSKMSGWIHMLKLLEILTFAQETLYPLQKADKWFRVPSKNFDQSAVTHLDSALNEWVDAVPDHLRWHALKDEDSNFLDISAMLYTTYYFVQITVHKPFIPSSRQKSNTVSLGSLAICANAARSCVHVVEMHARRGFTLLPHSMVALFNAGVILLLNVWGGRLAGLASEPQKELGDVYATLNILHEYEKRWTVAGRLSDVLRELLSAGNFPMSAPETFGTKRRREDDDTEHMGLPSDLVPDWEHITANWPLDSEWDLPLHTSDLQGLPVYGYHLDGVPAHQQPQAWTEPLFPSTAQDQWAGAQTAPIMHTTTDYQPIQPPNLIPMFDNLPRWNPHTAIARLSDQWEGYMTGVEEIFQSSRGPAPGPHSAAWKIPTRGRGFHI